MTPGAPVADQTRDVFGRIDALLAEVGSDKAKLLSATIWLSDIETFAEMKELWDTWVVPNVTPARACVEARPAAPQFTVEIALVAALCRDGPFNPPHPANWRANASVSDYLHLLLTYHFWGSTYLGVKICLSGPSPVGVVTLRAARI